MKHYLFILFFASTILFAQSNFELDLSAKTYVNDSLWFGAPMVRTGFEDLYQFKLVENDKLGDLSKKMNFDFSFYNLTIQNKNILKGKIDYPQPVALMHMSNPPSETDIFFIEKGKYTYELPTITNGLVVNLQTPSNIEYQKLKNYLATVYFKFDDPNRRDSLTSFDKKQELISSYIKEHPNSYVALWEIVNDYTLYNYNPTYLENMEFFSNEIKQSSFYKKLYSKLKIESETMIGKKIPDIYFDKTHSLKEEDFKKHKLTIIDYWSTTCAPCVKGMPELVKLYNDFKDKGVNIITITDENKIDRKALAEKILKKNNAEWTNYFDVNKEFSKRVNATGYPLQFVIDTNGKILARTFGDLDHVRELIVENLK
ncbi:TlpA family protein disulfide reductase [Kaistella flava (ex Peng et al. 2021)]|uniref:TlpA family protein disulfide reductase n=1 Tax=Kaistella flava (ex Peng et al. 2021) TaxID=2038776 RepID=A0A7M2YC69_9FLAO|nr:TlpA disulfide reductase family protein [Kaistella flava (ex Peng et al. 2021)]QOW11042.1 TlpA family protein disulfide reductase [Kaistella flava (ex Peng et al. 2021)]